jgi:cell division protein FtsB
MNIWFDIRKRLKQSVAPTICIALAAFFVYHAFQGDRGVLAMNRLNAEIELAKLALAKSDKKRQHLENRVSLVRPDGVDRDLLSELARQQLGMVHPDDIVIFYDN